MQAQSIDLLLLSGFERFSDTHLKMQVGNTYLPNPDVLRAANISPDTLLATDYLNHYNEVAMLMDFLDGTDEEITDEILAWKPEGYVDHFKHSGFRDKELAIEAFSCADPGLVSQFEKACKSLDTKIIAIQKLAIAGDFTAAGEIGGTLFDDIGAINGLIVGTSTPDPAAGSSAHEVEEGISQSDIDSLFS